MPIKVRQLEAELAQAGFVRQPAKGSHRKWVHPSGEQVTISGQPGADAQRYQIKQVEDAIERAKRHTP